MFKNAYKLVIVIAVFTMMAIISLQYAYMTYARRQADAKFDSTVKIALQNTCLKILYYNNQSKEGALNTLRDRAVRRTEDKDYYVVNVGVDIQRNILENILKVQFNKGNVGLDFEYAVYNQRTKKMDYGSYITSGGGISIDTDPSVFTPYNDPAFEYYFAVSFPGRRQFLVHEMRMWYFSFIFMLITLLFFTYTIFVIFKQRKFTETQKNFINNITHEFKTPLASIIMSSEVLNTEEVYLDRERMKRYSQIIMIQAKKLTSEIDRILQLMVSENNQTLLKLEKVNAYDFIYSCLRDAQLIGDQKNVRFTCDDRFMLIKADTVHLGNIITNLVNNAIKYGDTEKGVDVCLHHDAKICYLSVRDYGVGIDKKYQAKIFTRFFRVPTGDVHNVKGFGLGLSYVKHFVDLHHWKIEVVSTLGKGSMFTLKIPVE